MSTSQRSGPRLEHALWLGAVLLALAALAGLRLTVGGNVHAQSVIGWPTPPPGLAFAPPAQESVQANVRVPATRPGSQTVFVRPSWPGPIPLIPPIPSTQITFAEATGGPPVNIRIDAGTFAEGVQLRLTPVEPPTLEQARGVALWAFELEAFDLDAKEVRERPQRPIKLQVSTAPFIAAGVQGTHLEFAILDGARLQWLVTEFNEAKQLLTTRLVGLGTVLLLNDAP